MSYNGNELLFPAQLIQTGFTHRFVVEVEGQEIYFERDEEGAYRAMTNPETLTKEIKTDLLKAIAETIEAIVG